MLPLRGAQVQSLVRELRSHKSHSMAKNKQTKRVLTVVLNCLSLTRSGLSEGLKEVRGQAHGHLGDRLSRQRRASAKGLRPKRAAEDRVARQREWAECKGEIQMWVGGTRGICRAVSFCWRLSEAMEGLGQRRGRLWLGFQPDSSGFCVRSQSRSKR